MVSLNTTLDYVWLFLVAGAFGAVGGVAYELLQARQSEAGTLKLPKWGPDGLRLGFVASLVLGAIAAVAISYFFTPEIQVKVGEGAAQHIETQWQIVKVIPLSLIVGSAGGALLTAMQARVLAQVTEQKKTATKAAGKAAVDQLAASYKTAVQQVAATTGAWIETAAGKGIQRASADTPRWLRERFRVAELDEPHLKSFANQMEVEPETTPEEHQRELHQSVADAVSATASEAVSMIEAQAEAARRSIDEAGA